MVLSEIFKKKIDSVDVAEVILKLLEELEYDEVIALFQYYINQGGDNMGCGKKGKKKKGK